MPKVIVGDYEFENVDEYAAALQAWEEHRAPFRAEAELLTYRFVESLYEQGLSERTIHKHRMSIEMFIVYLTQYTDADDFATIRKGMVNTEFLRWYRRKVMNQCDSASLKSTTLKFFKFLAEHEGIYNAKVLGKPR